MSLPKTFRHLTIDGWILIDNATGTESRYPYSWWITQEPGYSTISGATVILYTEGGDQSINYYVKDNSVFPLPVDPWLAADGYIAKQSIYDAAYVEFIGTPTTLAQAKSIKNFELLAQMQIIRDGEIIFLADTFSSNAISYSRLKEELSYSLYLTDVPSGFYVNDITNTQITFTLTNLKDLVGGIEKLYYLCWLQYDIHFAAINALTTIGDVMAYNVTTGAWPTVPFTP